MKKIKICHVVSGLKSGGAEAMIYNYFEKMDMSKYECHILYQHTPLKKNVEEFEKLGFILKRITSKKKNIFKNYTETKKYFLENNIEIVHCHMTLANFIPLIAARRAKIKVRICHSHESEKPRIFLKKALYKLYKYLCVKNATTLVACGEEAGKFLYGKKEFIILNNALDIEKYSFKSEIRKKIRKDMGITDNTLVIGHIGRFIEVKNHTFIIDCFEKLTKENENYKLILIGNGELESKIKSIVAQKKLNDKVCFTGVVSNPYDYYNAFDLFILPSIREGLPIVALEAQANGLKCFLSKNIDKKSVIVDENCKMLELNEQKWIKELKEVNQSYERKNVKENFSEKNLEISKESKKLDELYKESYYGKK